MIVGHWYKKEPHRPRWWASCLFQIYRFQPTEVVRILNSSVPIDGTHLVNASLYVMNIFLLYLNWVYVLAYFERT